MAYSRPFVLAADCPNWANAAMRAAVVFSPWVERASDLNSRSQQHAAMSPGNEPGAKTWTSVFSKGSKRSQLKMKNATSLITPLDPLG